MKTNVLSRLIACFLCLIMLVCCVACAKSDSDTQTTTTLAGTDQTSSAVSEVTEDPKETLEVEEANYGGVEFNIYMSGNWTYHDFEAENITGEAINDAKYEVNSLIADKLNTVVVVKNDTNKSSGGSGTGFQTIMTAVMSGTKDYDAASIGCYDVGTLAYNGYLLDLTEVPNVDLSKSWWDPKMVDQLAINGHMYYATGDAMTLDNDCTYCILFNKTVRSNFNLDDPYELVEKNEWTFDKFLEMADACDSDLNGNGTVDVGDAFGLTIWTDSVIGMLHASGGRFATISEDGDFTMTLNNERNIEVMTRWITARSQAMSYYLVGSTSDADHAPFTENRCLFYTRYIKAASWFRDLNLDFGMLPYPKYDADQDSYCNTMHAYGTSYLCIPSVVEDPAMSGAVLESLSYYGKEYLTPAYYDVTLIGKYIRDEESIAMLDLIFSTRFFDIGTYYQLGGLNEAINKMNNDKNTSFTSIFKSTEKVAKNQMDKIVESFTKIGAKA